MKIDEHVKKAPESTCPLCTVSLPDLESYPAQVIDILIFHRLHFHMPVDLAAKAYQQFQSEFVDWNEVRISPIREIQEQVNRAESSLELSVFIKDLLEFVHRDRHKIDLEHLPRENLTDIRRYLKQVRNIDPASIDLVLMLRKGHPLMPLTALMEQAFLTLGLVSEEDSRDRKAKSLFELAAANLSRASGPSPPAANAREAAASNGSESPEGGPTTPPADGGEPSPPPLPDPEEIYAAGGGTPAFDTALSFHHLALNHCRNEALVQEASFAREACILYGIASEYGAKQRKASRSRSSGGSARSRARQKTAERPRKAKKRR